MSIGQIIYGIGTSALISFPIALACWKFFKWKLDICTTIGAAAFGGTISFFGFNIIAKWPLWLLTLAAIMIYVIVQRIALDHIDKIYGKKEV